jgi:hypothetical protein
MIHLSGTSKVLHITDKIIENRGYSAVGTPVKIPLRSIKESFGNFSLKSSTPYKFEPVDQHINLGDTFIFSSISKDIPDISINDFLMTSPMQQFIDIEPPLISDCFIYPAENLMMNFPKALSYAFFSLKSTGLLKTIPQMINGRLSRVIANTLQLDYGNRYYYLYIIEDLIFGNIVVRDNNLFLNSSSYNVTLKLLDPLSSLVLYSYNFINGGDYSLDVRYDYGDIENEIMEVECFCPYQGSKIEPFSFTTLNCPTYYYNDNSLLTTGWYGNLPQSVYDYMNIVYDRFDIDNSFLYLFTPIYYYRSFNLNNDYDTQIEGEGYSGSGMPVAYVAPEPPPGPSPAPLPPIPPEPPIPPVPPLPPEPPIPPVPPEPPVYPTLPDKTNYLFVGTTTVPIDVRTNNANTIFFDDNCYRVDSTVKSMKNDVLPRLMDSFQEQTGTKIFPYYMNVQVSPIKMLANVLTTNYDAIFKEWMTTPQTDAFYSILYSDLNFFFEIDFKKVTVDPVIKISEISIRTFWKDDMFPYKWEISTTGDSGLSIDATNMTFDAEWELNVSDDCNSKLGSLPSNFPGFITADLTISGSQPIYGVFAQLLDEAFAPAGDSLAQLYNGFKGLWSNIFTMSISKKDCFGQISLSQPLSFDIDTYGQPISCTDTFYLSRMYPDMADIKITDFISQNPLFSSFSYDNRVGNVPTLDDCYVDPVNKRILNPYLFFIYAIFNIPIPLIATVKDPVSFTLDWTFTGALKHSLPGSFVSFSYGFDCYETLDTSDDPNLTLTLTPRQGVINVSMDGNQIFSYGFGDNCILTVTYYHVATTFSTPEISAVYSAGGMPSITPATFTLQAEKLYSSVDRTEWQSNLSDYPPVSAYLDMLNQFYDDYAEVNFGDINKNLQYLFSPLIFDNLSKKKEK